MAEVIVTKVEKDDRIGNTEVVTASSDHTRWGAISTIEFRAGLGTYRLGDTVEIDMPGEKRSVG